MPLRAYVLLQDGGLLSKLLTERSPQLSVTIGSENVFKELENSSMILSGYSVMGQNAGSVGIIGPTRIDYAKADTEHQVFVLACGQAAYRGQRD